MAKAFVLTFTDYGPYYCEFSDGHMKGGFDANEPVTPGGPLVAAGRDDMSGIRGDACRTRGTGKAAPSTSLGIAACLDRASCPEYRRRDLARWINEGDEPPQAGRPLPVRRRPGREPCVGFSTAGPPIESY